MKIVSLLAFLLLAVTVFGLGFSIGGVLIRRIKERGRATVIVFLLLVTIGVAWLSRPHEDTFAGLDNSGYRLMARAFSMGRGMHENDAVLLEAPRSLRNSLMLLPTMDERNTRDRSFMVKSLDSCETEPFFYPLLPLCAVGFDAMLPGDNIDGLVPALGIFFLVMCLMFGAAYGGVPGMMVASALLAGSPLPGWLFRGFYVETVASVLIASAAMCWLAGGGDRRPSFVAYFALGLGVSFHPAMIAAAVPVLMLFVLDPGERVGRIFAGLVLFGAGVLVMILMGLFACAPYGSISFETLSFNAMASSSHRVTTVCAVLFGFALLAGLIAKSFVWKGVAEMGEGKSHISTVLISIAALGPLLYAGMYWSQRHFVIAGLDEAVRGCGPVFGVAVGLLAMILLFSKGCDRSRLLFAAMLMAVPVFAYLKGAEQMGLWSQRRLIMPYLLLVVSLLGCAVVLIERICMARGSKFSIVAVLGSLLLLAASAWNPVKWPAPYTVRCDRGAWQWIEEIRRKMEGRLVFFDYFGFSIPFAVDGRTRAVGLCEGAGDVLDGVFSWLSARAEHESVWCATAYSNPGIEAGARLDYLFAEKKTLKQVVGKGAIPAERRWRDVQMDFLKVTPIVGDVSPPGMKKVFDRGPLAVRGKWGRGDVRIQKPDGSLLPARWSREGSGVVGPVPLPGDAICVTIEASACRDDGIDAQVVMVVPPWTGPPLLLTITNGWTVASGVLSRPPEAVGYKNRTGTFRLQSKFPYDPSRAGMTGFDSDLGVLIHSMAMEPMDKGAQ